MVVYTIGFSNRSWEDTLEILRAYDIQRVVDIRTLPGSRRTPQFNQENLATALRAAGVEYIHLKALGGLRRLRSDNPENAGWRNESFRAYADYMQTEEFRLTLEELMRLLVEKRLVYACTEAVFWRCHRALVSDALLIRGCESRHIFSATKWEPHRLTTFAKVEGLRITYPA